MNTLKPPQLNIDKSEEFAKLIVDRYPDSVEKFKTSKTVVGFLTGLAMKECKGTVNPALMREAIIEELEARIK